MVSLRALHRKRFRLSIRSVVVLSVMLATIVSVAVALCLQYYFIRELVTEKAVDRYNRLAVSSSEYLKMLDNRAEKVARVLAAYPALVSDHWVNPDARRVFAEILDNNPMLYAIYLGFENGDFYEVINLDGGKRVREQLHAQPQDRWAVITISGSGAERQRKIEYYSADFQLRSQRYQSSSYDATRRLWYVQAKPGTVNKTVPYFFHNLQEAGQTYSIALPNGGAVLGVDIVLSALSESLQSHQLAEDGEVFIYQAGGELIASTLPANPQQLIEDVTPLELTGEEQQWLQHHPVLRVSNESNWMPIDFSMAGHPYGYSIDYLELIARMTGVKFDFVNGFSWPQLVELFRQGQLDILQPVFDNELVRESGQATDPFLTLPYSLVTRLGREPVTHIDQLQGWVVAIPQGWSVLEVMRKHYPGIQVIEVPSNREVFKAVLDGRADAGLDARAVLHFTERQYFFNGLQYHDKVEFTPQPLPDQLRFVFQPGDRIGRNLFNRAIAQVTAEQQQALEAKWFKDVMSVSAPNTGMVPYPELITLAASANPSHPLQQVRLNGIDHFVHVVPFGPDHRAGEYFAVVVPVKSVLQPTLDKLTWAVVLTVGFLLLLLPIPWLLSTPIVRPIKALALENEKISQRAFADLSVPRSGIREIDELGQSLVTMSSSIQQHEANQIALMDSFIKLIAQAVDDKSRATAGHCERVPELAIMLAEAAEQSAAAPFTDFAFASAAERREFKVAAWLHDCGKITTPEHIEEKGSKLEVIYNRIHEVRTRFEVLWRDAEVRYWQQRTQIERDDGEGIAALQRELDAARAQLQDDYAFVAGMNIGGESTSAASQERLQRIASITWTRHFSNRLGLSPFEARRLPVEKEVLPCTETLLQDRPEHLIPRDKTEYDPQLGINMTVPHYLYNQGELYNLSIERGTLTAEDRFKINEHVISTIRMLEALPLPPELARVPRYASTHHETLIGTGYPRKLTAAELSIPERILSLADVFEALTAADRPYKSAKSVSEAITILAKMTARQHVDLGVFELFLTSGVYLRYAHRFLPQAQLDEIDVEAALRVARGQS